MSQSSLHLSPSVLIYIMKIQRSLQDELESREKNGNHFPDPILLSLFLRICQVISLLVDHPLQISLQAVRELHKSSPPLAHRLPHFCTGSHICMVNNATSIRDIKPHNVLLTKDFSPVLMDFGSTALARITPANLKEAAYLQASYCSHRGLICS